MGHKHFNFLVGTKTNEGPSATLCHLMRRESKYKQPLILRVDFHSKTVVTRRYSLSFSHTHAHKQKQKHYICFDVNTSGCVTQQWTHLDIISGNYPISANWTHTLTRIGLFVQCPWKWICAMFPGGWVWIIISSWWCTCDSVILPIWPRSQKCKQRMPRGTENPNKYLLYWWEIHKQAKDENMVKTYKNFCVSTVVIFSAVNSHSTL